MKKIIIRRKKKRATAFYDPMQSRDHVIFQYAKLLSLERRKEVPKGTVKEWRKRYKMTKEEIEKAMIEQAKYERAPTSRRGFIIRYVQLLEEELEENVPPGSAARYKNKRLPGSTREELLAEAREYMSPKEILIDTTPLKGYISAPSRFEAPTHTIRPARDAEGRLYTYEPEGLYSKPMPGSRTIRERSPPPTFLQNAIVVAMRDANKYEARIEYNKRHRTGRKDAQYRAETARIAQFYKTLARDISELKRLLQEESLSQFRETVEKPHRAKTKKQVAIVKIPRINIKAGLNSIRRR